MGRAYSRAAVFTNDMEGIASSMPKIRKCRSFFVAIILLDPIRTSDQLIWACRRSRNQPNTARSTNPSRRNQNRWGERPREPKTISAIRFIPVFISEPCGALHADVCRNAAQDNCRHAAPPEFQIKFRPVEGAPLVFGDHEIARFRSQFRNNVRPVGRRGLSLHWRVSDGTQRVFSVRRRSNPH